MFFTMIVNTWIQSEMVYTMFKRGGVQYIKIFSMTMTKLTIFVTDGIICIISAARLFEPY